MGETFTTEIQPRYRDLNMAGHVDNVEAVRILDEARLEFFRFAPLPDLPEGRAGLLHAVPSGVSELVASQTITYRSEMRFAPYQPFLVTLWVSRVGGSSFTVSAELRVERDGAPAVLWECVNVLWDHAAHSSWQLDDDVRSTLERYLAQAVAR